MAHVVKAACPHDCPDTCAMEVTVEGDRAVSLRGAPDHPVTSGALCAKVNDYLERVYAPDRLLEPLIRTGPKGSGEFRPASWGEAIDLVASRLAEVRHEHGGEAILPYSYLGTMGFLQADLMSARVMNALGATDLARTICADAGIAGVVTTHGLSPEVDPELWPQARFVIVWAWNPLSTAPHLWRFVNQARRNGARLVVVDPYRSRTARVADTHVAPLPGTDAALALGMMRAMVDEGVQDEQWCRAHANGYDELLGRLDEWPVERAAHVCDVPAGLVRRLGVEFATTQPSLVRLGVGGQRHLGAPIAYRTIACLPGLAGSWRHVGGGCSYIPTATVTAVRSQQARRTDLRPGPVRRLNMSALGDALTDPDLTPPVKALVCWNSNPAQIAPDQERVMAGLGRDDLFCVVLEQFMTDTARHADVVLPATTQLEHLDAVASWGHHYLTWNEPAIRPLGQSKPNSEIFRLLAARLGFDDPCFAESDEEMLRAMLATAPDDVTFDGLRERGWQKIDLGQGPTPHADGGFGTPDGKLQLRADGLAGLDLDPLPTFDLPAEIADDARRERFPFALVTPKTHFFLNTTFADRERQRAAQGRPFVAVHPDDAATAGVSDGQRVAVSNDRGSFEAELRVTDEVRPGVAVAPMGWWATDHHDGTAAQATTSQRLTVLGEAPTFNDNRVAISPT
ncbi:MAG: molybdopterin-dependent oxidoreductase [Acidimicrobiia bacterium]